MKLSKRPEPKLFPRLLPILPQRGLGPRIPIFRLTADSNSMGVLIIRNPDASGPTAISLIVDSRTADKPLPDRLVPHFRLIADSKDRL